MPGNKQRGHIWRIVAGASFVVTAVGWLVVNEQRRRARLALMSFLRARPPRVRNRLAEVWRWWLNSWVDPWGPYRRQLASEARGDVLEVGVGTWPNVVYFGAVERLVGVEAKRRRVFAARQRMRRFRPRAEVAHAPAEALPFPDESFDTVVTSLALCSVKEQAAALAEIARVLRPGGTLRFLEHVRSRRRPVALAQDALTPLWRLFADGCRPNRDTLVALRVARFEVTAHEYVSGAWGPARPTVRGVATRPPCAPAEDDS